MELQRLFAFGGALTYWKILSATSAIRVVMKSTCGLLAISLSPATRSALRFQAATFLALAATPTPAFSTARVGNCCPPLIIGGIVVVLVVVARKKDKGHEAEQDEPPDSNR